MKTFEELLAESMKEKVIDTDKGESDLSKTLDKDGKPKSDNINDLPTKAIKGEVSNKDDKLKKGEDFKNPDPKEEKETSKDDTDVKSDEQDDKEPKETSKDDETDDSEKNDKKESKDKPLKESYYVDWISQIN